MNGVASARMRESGLMYHVNFGIELPRLQQIADEVRSQLSSPEFSNSNYQFSIPQQLWLENVRESKILAAMLMPTEHFLPDQADIWVNQIPNAEIAQTTVLYLFARLPYAPRLALQWLASEQNTTQLCGLLLTTRLFIQGVPFDERSKQEIFDQVTSLSQSPNLHVRKAAHNLCLRLTEK